MPRGILVIKLSEELVQSYYVSQFETVPNRGGWSVQSTAIHYSPSTYTIYSSIYKYTHAHTQTFTCITVTPVANFWQLL